MLESVSWLLTIQIVGLAAFPFAFAAFPNLADRAWGFAKPLGLIIIGLAIWGLSQLGVLPNAPWAWRLAIGVLAVAGATFAWPRRAEIIAAVRRNSLPIAVGETLFLAFFVAWTLFRLFDPNIAGTEKPMDFMFLNASTIAQAAPPEDPWMSGQPVAYYYFGYWMFAGLGKAASVQPSIAYNLSLSLVAAMAAGAIFTLVYSMVRKDDGPMRSALWAGAAASLLLLAVSSLAGWWELLANFGIGSDGFYNWLAIDNLERNDQPGSWRPTEFWWWWRASRVINTFNESGIGLDFTIQEFPLFSFVLGDLHPHVMSIPFVLTGLGAAFNILASRERWGFPWLRKNPAAAICLALLIGAAGFINAWDLMFLTTALMGAALLNTATHSRPASALRKVLSSTLSLASIGAVGILAFSTFYFGTLAAQIRLPPIAPADFGSRPIHFLTVWGLLLLISGAFLSVTAWRTLRPQFLWARDAVEGRASAFARPGLAPWTVALSGVILPYLIWAFAHLEFIEGAQTFDLITRLWTVLPLGAIVVILFVTVVKRAGEGNNDAAQFALLGSLIAAYLLYGAELLHVHDAFGNRMNTVFKFYYQGWIILSAIGAYALWRWRSIHRNLKGWRLGASAAAAVLGVVLLAGSLYYTAAATVTKAGEGGGNSLDGLAYLERTAPDEFAAIQFLRENADPGDRLVEAVGGSYSDFGRVSGSTGIPTILGWPGHELQWRGSNELVTPRENDVQQLYTTSDRQSAASIIDRYGIDYVIVGKRDRSKYPSLDVTKFDTLGIRVFEENHMTIYCFKEDCP